MDNLQTESYLMPWECDVERQSSEDEFDPMQFGFTPIRERGQSNAILASDAHLHVAITKNTRNGKTTDKKTCRLQLAPELYKSLPVDDSIRIGIAIDEKGCICLYKGKTRKISSTARTSYTISLDSMYDIFVRMFGKGADVDYSASKHPSGQAYILTPKR